MKAITSILTVLAATSLVASAADEKPTTGNKPQATDNAPSVAPAAATPTPGAKPKMDPEAAFKKLDKDGDGSVSLEEFKGSARAKKDPAKAEEFFKKKDKDSDGKLTLEEFKAQGGGKKKAK
jgi:hypothetical protein